MYLGMSLCKLQKIRDREKSPECKKEKKHHTCRRTKIKRISNFLDTVQEENGWEYLKCWEKKIASQNSVPLSLEGEGK